MHCYKCKESDPNKLSLKKQQRDIMTFVCRSCRNSAARAWKARRSLNRREYIGIDPNEWNRWATESHQRIIKSYEARMQVIQ